MLKISITLPNNAQINLETADAAIIDQILDVVLRDITHNLTGATAASDSGGTSSLAAAAATPAPVVSPPATPPPAAAPVRSWETETAAPEPETVAPETTAPAPEITAPEKETVPSPWPTANHSAAAEAADLDADLDPEDDDWPDYDDAAATTPTTALIANGATAPRPGMFAPSEQAFIDFCREASPLGDMRRVVVAAEGASRYLGMSGVDAQSLGHLFNLAGWPQAHNFTQTLRNSARSKFRWLERVPGRAGYYAVTDLGRKTALGG